MKRILLLSMLCLAAITTVAEDEYALATAKTDRYKDLQIGVPVIVSTSCSVTESLYHVTDASLEQHDQITKITYRGYNPGEEHSRHLTVWMQNTRDFDVKSRQTDFYPTSDMTKVFEGDCIIAHGGTAVERIPLLEITLDEPFIYSGQSLRISIVCSGEIQDTDVYFEQFQDYSRQGRKAKTYEGDGTIQNSTICTPAMIEFEVLSKVGYCRGKVTDQDGTPVPDAQISLLSSWGGCIGTTKADGNYDIRVVRGTRFYSPSVSAPGHTSYTTEQCFSPLRDDGSVSSWALLQSEDGFYNFTIYNALNYKAGKRYTIVLPIAPDASAGRYFRLDRVEGGNIIFEREYSPQAAVPYVFYPNKDLRIDLREMDLSKEAGTTKVIVAHDGVGSRDAAYFMGSYTHKTFADILEVDTPVYFDDDDQGQKPGAYHIDALHATLLWNWHAFGTPFQPSYESPSFVFHDPDEDISPYRHFFEEGKVWKVGIYSLDGDLVAIESHFFDGDTIIGDFHCKKMIEAYDNLVTGTHTESYCGAIYEDSKRVYCAWPNWKWFAFLYDFASIEDCDISFFDFDLRESCPINGHIQSKSFRQDEKFHGWTKTFAEATMYDGETYNETFEWMEGVGYQGFYNFIKTNKAGYYRELLSCTVGDEVLYYDAALWNDDNEVKKNTIDFTHVVKTQPKAPRSLSPSPSPEREGSESSELKGEYSLKELFVNFKPLAGPYVITICDDSGTEVYRKEVQTSNVIGLNTDISDYPKGEYTITVENDEEVYTAKFNIDDVVGIRRPTPDPSRNGGEKAGAVYDLSGRQIVNRRSAQSDASHLKKSSDSKLNKGIYIKDGRKVVVR